MSHVAHQSVIFIFTVLILPGSLKMTLIGLMCSSFSSLLRLEWEVHFFFSHQLSECLISFLYYLFCDCRRESSKMALVPWRGPSRTTSSTARSRRPSTSWGWAPRSTVIWRIRLGPCSLLPVFTVKSLQHMTYIILSMSTDHIFINPPVTFRVNLTPFNV